MNRRIYDYITNIYDVVFIVFAVNFSNLDCFDKSFSTPVVFSYNFIIAALAAFYYHDEWLLNDSDFNLYFYWMTLVLKYRSFSLKQFLSRKRFSVNDLQWDNIIQTDYEIACYYVVR